MKQVLVEMVVVLLLLGVNGVFAMTEIAVVTARKGRLRQLAKGGHARAQLALALAESPNRFLSTVQIGITLVGILAGAFSGATIAEELALALAAVPGLGPYSDVIALGVVVLVISYLSLVLGELVPKRIGLGNPERISMLVAGPMQALSVVAGPLVRSLSLSTDGLLRLLAIKPQKEATVSEDEVKVLMQEGLRAGAFQKVESDIVASVLDLDRLMVRDIMTPRPKVIWLNRDDPHETVWHKIVVSGHSFFPVYEGNRDRVVGVVSVKAVYANLAAGVGVNLRDLMVPPLVVPATQNVLQLVETFKRSGKHLALAADEFGGIVGLVTLNDVMEAIVGDFPSQDERAKPAVTRRPDGSWLIDGMIEIARVEQALPGFVAEDPSNKEYQTLAGYIVKRLGRLPREGETFEAHGYVFEVLDMDQHRVDKVLVVPLRPPAGSRTLPAA
ncbi:MAG TPA: hemolysin family protein [Candidatus Paceibacterota bacterium]|nr:hemolysin family protein [Verrucomicrobiota bacterium]HSA09203.1 hemolysin family protein [Candidatus Paceibacterota bacterium]